MGEEQNKRPRFGLRLLLLVVALLATIFAWRHAVAELRLIERNRERSDLESEIKFLENASAQGHRDLEASQDVGYSQELAKNLDRVDSDISQLKRKLKAFD